MRVAPWLLAFWLFYPFCAAAGSSTPADPAAPGDCAEPAKTPIHSGNADPKPKGQDEELDALRKAAEQRRTSENERSRTGASEAPAESDPARR
jgi:hypothetical protein